MSVGCCQSWCSVVGKMATTLAPTLSAQPSARILMLSRLGRLARRQAHPHQREQQGQPADRLKASVYFTHASNFSTCPHLDRDGARADRKRAARVLLIAWHTWNEATLAAETSRAAAASAEAAAGASSSTSAFPPMETARLLRAKRTAEQHLDVLDSEHKRALRRSRQTCRWPKPIWQPTASEVHISPTERAAAEAAAVATAASRAAATCCPEAAPSPGQGGGASCARAARE